MTEPVMKKKTSVMPDWSQLPEELLHIVSTHLEDCCDIVHARSVCSLFADRDSPNALSTVMLAANQTNMAELVSVLGRPTTMKKTSSSILPDWTKLPEELLDVILSEKLDNCFDVVHARSVCSLWRSSFPFPSCLVRPSYSLPTYPIEKVGLWDLEKIPLFLFRSRATLEYFVGGVGKDDPMLDRPSPLQCSVKAKISRFDHTVRNMVDCQIVPLGHQYRFICWNPEGGKTAKRIVAFLPVSKEGGGKEFVVLHHYSRNLLVLKSAEKKWLPLANVPNSRCEGLVTFRGRFYATFRNRDIFVIDPYSLETTLLLMPTQGLVASNYLVQAGSDELFLVQKNSIFVSRFRVSKLDEKAGRWVEVSDLGDRVLLLGEMGNVSFFAKELPDGCGVTRNSVLFTYDTGKETKFFIYDLNCWRLSSGNCVKILNKFPVLSFRVEC